MFDIDVVATLESSGDGVYEDVLCVIEESADNPFLCAGVFDGRRAWKEGGDAEALIQNCNTESTGQAVAQFAARQFSHYCLRRGIIYRPFCEILLNINRDWRVQVLNHCSYETDVPEHLPGCAATMVRINQKDSLLEFAHVCDTKIILFKKNGSFLVPTIDNMYKLDRILFDLMLKNAEKLGTSPRVAMYETDYTNHPDLKPPIELDLEHRSLENKSIEAEVGVLNGMENMEVFYQTGSVLLDEWDYLLLCTDGLLFPAVVGEHHDLEGMIQFLLNHELSLDTLVQEVRRIEDSDLNFERYVHFAYHSDATGVLLELHH
jgi:serine/threonine protein phosphatase PrpC